MLKLFSSRFLQGLLTLFVLVTLTFFLVRLMPGSPYTAEKAVPEHILKELKASSGLDQPSLVQYGLYLRNLVFRGDMGPLIKKDGVSVYEVISDSFPVSLVLGLASMGIALMIGIPAGVIAAVKKNSPADFASLAFAMIGICLPSFVIGPLLAVGAGLHLHSLNVAGWSSPTDWILPAITLGLPTAAYLARLSRGGMLDVLSQDYIRTARAKGVPGRKIITRHALKGGLIPAVAFIGPAFAAMISGSFVIETIFQIPGMGQHFVNAATDREFFLIQGLVLFYGFLIVAANLMADLALVALNPRLR
ncbi:MAG: ABC transporter permease [Akkermansiaceae bacterium]|jgi:oligopeptide transport system permease protein|nr:ABC transporter permease [Akkermansiaceae bacterium]MDP4646076.1 ABC transporter permease [Akkermansiaceae bacterium]MDP4720875.1 ABC transporter permease [Akkermansiaceae bacterium]MDP4780766.1 ABC transporter permease [Akkermansiaceae bacterium]MDP4845712.1 ABC transporter permease [Akkermansiaceae bacterium]